MRKTIIACVACLVVGTALGAGGSYLVLRARSGSIRDAMESVERGANDNRRIAEELRLEASRLAEERAGLEREGSRLSEERAGLEREESRAKEDGGSLSRLGEIFNESLKIIENGKP